MFRARIYAQGFTLVAIVVGGVFYKDERLHRKRFESAKEDKKAAEKREKWIRELEARDEEDRAWRAKIEGAAQRAHEASMAAKEGMLGQVKNAEQAAGKVQDALSRSFGSKSALETWQDDAGSWTLRMSRAWRRQ